MISAVKSGGICIVTSKAMSMGNVTQHDGLSPSHLLTAVINSLSFFLDQSLTGKVMPVRITCHKYTLLAREGKGEFEDTKSNLFLFLTTIATL